jgi:DNA polymerase-3 subunit beta
MRITVPTALLTDAAGNASAVAAAKSPKRILECIAIKASKADGITLEATDLDVAIRIRLPEGKVEDEGAVVVSAARLVSVLREIAEKTVTLVENEGRLEIDSANCRFRIHTDDAGEFPVLPEFPAAAALSVKVKDLRDMIRRTAFATAREPGRFALHGVLLRLAGGVLEMVGTDGRRLARATRKVPSKDGPQKSEVKAIVGAKALALLDRAAGEESASVDVALEERQILFRSGNVLLASRLIDGSFPSYEDVIPKPSTKSISVPADTLSTALRRASLLTTREAQSVQMEFAKNSLVITSRAADVGEAKVKMDVEYQEGEERLGFNPAFLLDALKVMPPERKVRFEFSSPKSPGKLTDGDDYVYVVMPVSVE